MLLVVQLLQSGLQSLLRFRLDQTAQRIGFGSAQTVQLSVILARLSRRSIAATITFMLTALVTVFVIRHLA